MGTCRPPITASRLDTPAGTWQLVNDPCGAPALVATLSLPGAQHLSCRLDGVRLVAGVRPRFAVGPALTVGVQAAAVDQPAALAGAIDALLDAIAASSRPAPARPRARRRGPRACP